MNISMKKLLKKTTPKMQKFIRAYGVFTLTIIVALGAVSSYALYTRQKAEAAILPVLIGGVSLGVIDVCCNGLVLGYVPANPAVNPVAAMFVPGVSIPFSYYFQAVPTSCALGTAYAPPVACLSVKNKCAGGLVYPTITTIGTSVAGCALSQGAAAGAAGSQ